jgi:hypothetical protein
MHQAGYNKGSGFKEKEGVTVTGVCYDLIRALTGLVNESFRSPQQKQL